MRKLILIASIILVLLVAGGAQASVAQHPSINDNGYHAYSGPVWLRSAHTTTGNLGLVVSQPSNGYVYVFVMAPSGVTIRLPAYPLAVDAKNTQSLWGIFAWVLIGQNYVYTLIPLKIQQWGCYFIIPLTSSIYFPIHGGGYLFVPFQDPSLVIPSNPIFGYIII